MEDPIVRIGDKDGANYLEISLRRSTGDLLFKTKTSTAEAELAFSVDEAIALQSVLTGWLGVRG